ncbi:hypothetical protein ACE5JW_11635 [Acinetobacter radioresistens]|jgi:hypothetical protein|nr:MULTISPECIES: hypothetical protein [Acinetobacter]EXB76824.1 hypothetical protein J538_3332 [Acinetobacter sp. 272263]MCK4093541.1 hypothetical protein [Acinetobacter radioresistens]MCK4106286.1 hypothetical protein [Acinetobacter radioresistens]MCK4114980.1 hypothetical protein [Acinetobacter radioresistens]MCX0337502.1 hypothetical protein [Acinetobacter radioresistens]
MPNDYTRIENDGTYWKEVNGQWFYWREIWGWCPYVGSLNQNFFNKFK